MPRMTKKHLILLPLALLLSSCNTTQATQEALRIGQALLNAGTLSSNSAITQTDIVAAFKQALSIGTGNVVQQLGVTDGFNLDPKVHIPLPSSLAKVQDTLDTVGLSFMLDDLETRLNRAAEIATPHAKELFVDAISQMTFDDVMTIYNGPQDSATKYFQSKMSSPLAQQMSPFVQNAVNQAGVVQAYDKVMDQYKNLPFMPDVKSNLTNHVIEQGISGIFYYLGEQEKAIRQDPVKQTTELLRKVFGEKR